jgi:hypothetical protein
MFGSDSVIIWASSKRFDERNDLVRAKHCEANVCSVAVRRSSPWLGDCAWMFALAT